jgi:hypothetical protein
MQLENERQKEINSELSKEVKALKREVEQLRNEVAQCKQLCEEKGKRKEKGGWLSWFFSAESEQEQQRSRSDSPARSAPRIVSKTRTIALAMNAGQMEGTLLADELCKALATQRQSVHVRLVEEVSAKDQPLVLAVFFSSGPRLASPLKVRGAVKTLLKEFKHVGVCLLRYGDNDSTIIGDSAEDPDFYNLTSVGDERLSFFLQMFKGQLFFPSQVNEKSLSLLTQALGRVYS